MSTVILLVTSIRSNFYNPVDDRPWYINFSDEVSNMTTWSQTSVRGLKFIAAAAAPYTAADFTLKNLVLKLWIWTLLFWPWLASITLGATAASLAYKKHAEPQGGDGSTTGNCQMAHTQTFQGFVDGYSILMFGVYFVYSYMKL